MTGALTLYRTSVGKKIIMALSGFMLVGFVVFHMYGNLKMYQGAAAFNDYALGLRMIGYPIFGYEDLLWIARFGLIAAVFAHIWAATSLTLQSRESTMARGVMPGAAYGKKKRQTSYAAYTMRWGGVVLLLFIIFHLLHLTFGVVGYGAGEFIHPHGSGSGTEFEAYNNVVFGFQNPLIVGFYTLATIFLGLHLFHGVWSMFQTLGLNNRKYDMLFRGLAIAVAVVVVVGNLTFPIAVLSGIVS